MKHNMLDTEASNQTVFLSLLVDFEKIYILYLFEVKTQNNLD